MVVITVPTGPITDRELIAWGDANPEYQVERDARGGLIVSPSSTNGGSKSFNAALQLHEYARRAGGKVYDSSTGFCMPDGAVLSPDAAWLDDAQLAGVDRTATFWRVVPAVVVEVRSPSDSWRSTTAKIDGFLDAGAAYAVAIDPTTREVYERGTPPPGLHFDFDAIADA